MKTQQTHQDSESIDIKALLFQCLFHWKWFVLSGILAIVGVYFYIQTTRPTYKYKSEVLIKDEKSGKNIGNNNAVFSDLGIIQSNNNIHNELTIMQSPAVMLDVVKQLHLDMNYYVQRRFRKDVVYGSSLPIAVSLPDLSDEESVSFKITIYSDSTFNITKLRYFSKSKAKRDESKTVFAGHFHDTISSPVGRIFVEPNGYYLAGEPARQFEVVRSGFYSTMTSYSSRVSISLQRETSILTLEIKDQSIERSIDVLNKIVDVYNTNWEREKEMITASTYDFINHRLMMIEKDLNLVDEDISKFKSQHLLPDVDAVSRLYLDQSSKTSNQLLKLNNQLNMVRFISDYMIEEGNQYALLPVNSGIDNFKLEAQINEYNAKMLQRNSLEANSSMQNPLVLDLNRILGEMRSAIIKSIDNQIVSLESQIKSFREDEQRTIDRLSSNPSEAKYLLSVERQQKIKEALYLFLLQKREENALEQAFVSFNTFVVTPPMGTSAPVKPNKKMLLLIALVVGLGIPVGVITVTNLLFDTKVSGKRDLEGISVPIVGTIPLEKRQWKRSWFRRNQPMPLRCVVGVNNRNLINEAFRVLRTNIESISHDDSGAKIFIVTSFNPGSGKSFISLNLSACLALKGKKILLIDGDLRFATLSRFIGSPDSGLCDWLDGTIENIDSVIVNDTHRPHLSFLPVGAIPSNPTELLDQQKVVSLMEELKTRYDYIFVDTPPINIVADTHLLSTVCDRTLFIIRCGVLERDMLFDLEHIYGENILPKMSIVLNGTDNNIYGYHHYGHHYGYHYGYGKGYGYGYGSESKKSSQ